jgi:transposase
MHPCLIREGIASHVVEAASIAASRRSRRAKTDKPDGQALVRTLLAYRRGELRVCAMVTVPSAEDEDRRRVCRERRSLVVERIRHVIPKRDESVSSRFGQARAALEHFQGLMRQHLRALVSIASRARCLRKGLAITNRCARTGVRGR